jgi:hypothetical protein
LIYSSKKDECSVYACGEGKWCLIIALSKV